MKRLLLAITIAFLAIQPVAAKRPSDDKIKEVLMPVLCFFYHTEFEGQEFDKVPVVENMLVNEKTISTKYVMLVDRKSETKPFLVRLVDIRAKKAIIQIERVMFVRSSGCDRRVSFLFYVRKTDKGWTFDTEDKKNSIVFLDYNPSATN